MGTIWSDLVKAEIVHQAWPLMNSVAEQLWSPAVVTALEGVPTSRYKDQCARLQQRGVLNATECEPPPPPPPPPPPAPPPPPVVCTPHTGVKLNNTKYADGNGPRTTPDAKGCCDLCSATAGCHHWAFQIDSKVPGKTCHWATLTYCCWMHASATDAVAATGWTSDVSAGAPLKSDDDAATSTANSSEGLMLFFDGKYLSSAVNIARQVGTPQLLSTFADPMSFVGWGYPSVWRDGAMTRLVYEANFNHSHLPRVQLLAESADDVTFTLTDTTKSMSIAQRLRPNQILEPNVGTERGCVFDDGISGQVGMHRLKMLMSNASVLEGDASGTNWQRRPHKWAPGSTNLHSLS